MDHYQVFSEIVILFIVAGQKEFGSSVNIRMKSEKLIILTVVKVGVENNRFISLLKYLCNILQILVMSHGAPVDALSRKISAFTDPNHCTGQEDTEEHFDPF